MNIRKVVKTKQSTDVYEGAGVRVSRILSNNDVYDYDPFLLLDTFDIRKYEDYIKGFPWHPHRGIETVTYLIKGAIEHGDSLGNKGIITDGDCQWMTAGSGIIHQEMPIESEKIFGFQLWVNLAAKDKMTHPAYRDIIAKNIPVVQEENFTARVISGHFQNVKGAIEADYVKVNLTDIEVKPDKEININSDPEMNAFVLILAGEASLSPGTNAFIKPKAVALLSEGDSIYCKSSDEGARIIIFEGKSLKEPIAWGGPIVMNTREELEHAFAELRNDSFIKHKI